jgi:PST family polysaccharide transporter
LLAPTIAIFAIINPLGWLIFSIGLVARGMKAAPVLATIMITGYVIGLPYGPRGVAFAYSAVLTLWVIPHILWCVHGTVISLRDVLLTVSRPMASGAVAGAVAFGVRLSCGSLVSPWPRLVLETSVLLVAFFGTLLFAGGQKSLYLDLVRGLRGSSSIAERISVSA